jgi:tetratricopeptide (TPR) repeat protein
MRSRDPLNCRLAAYHISRLYERRKEPKKGLFYARIACDRTRLIENPDPQWIASNHNQTGNLLAAESRFEEAAQEYRQAMAAYPGDPGDVAYVLFQQNLGFCELMLERPQAAFPLLVSALRTLRRYGADSLLALAHLDLAYGYLEIGRYHYAVRHAEQARCLAEQHGPETTLKNALYLLGEAWHLSGHEDTARRHFEHLGESYADVPFLADFLLAVDVRKMINLRA